MQAIQTHEIIEAPPSDRWMAHRGDYDLDIQYATGATPEEATQNLLDMEE